MSVAKIPGDTRLDIRAPAPGGPAAMEVRPRRYLDEPWLTQRLALDQARVSLQQLAQDQALPLPMRETCARMFRLLGQFARTLHREALARRREP